MNLRMPHVPTANTNMVRLSIATDGEVRRRLHHLTVTD
jgi:hypothetical protein